MKLKPGDYVELATGEVGIIVTTWLDEHGAQDCYVAFYGENWPKLNTKPEKPYILRYYASSLNLVEPNFGE